MTSDEAIIIAAGVGSLPAWAALAVSLHTQRRTLPAQTSELKQHIDATGTAPPEPGPVPAWGDDL